MEWEGLSGSVQHEPGGSMQVIQLNFTHVELKDRAATPLCIRIQTKRGRELELESLEQLLDAIHWVQEIESILINGVLMSIADVQKLGSIFHGKY